MRAEASHHSEQCARARREFSGCGCGQWDRMPGASHASSRRPGASTAKVSFFMLVERFLQLVVVDGPANLGTDIWCKAPYTGDLDRLMAIAGQYSERPALGELIASLHP
eukprot:1161851-Pelagomonas_calceolata.AAC.3